MSLELLHCVDPYANLRERTKQIAEIKGEWAGIPMPLDGQRLVLEDSYPYGGLADIGAKSSDPALKYADVRNIFFSSRLGCRIAICKDDQGFFVSHFEGSGTQATALLNTIGASDAWGIEQESKAVQLLATLARHRQFKQYMLTGSFIETSKRSGVTYIFRRLRPTLALSSRTGQVRILCALCMHPIGYYEESWGGSLCPTDDVIAHLLLMRGDEHMFWKRCAQHSPTDPASGI